MSERLKKVLYPVMAMAMIAPLGEQMATNNAATANAKQVKPGHVAVATGHITLRSIQRMNHALISSGNVSLGSSSIDELIIPKSLHLTSGQKTAIREGRVAKDLTDTQKKQLIECGITNQAENAHNMDALNRKDFSAVQIPAYAKLSRVQIHELRSNQKMTGLNQQQQNVLNEYGIPVRNGSSVISTLAAYNSQPDVIAKQGGPIVKVDKAKAATVTGMSKGAIGQAVKASPGITNADSQMINKLSNLDTQTHSSKVKKLAKRLIVGLMMGDDKQDVYRKANALLSTGVVATRKSAKATKKTVAKAKKSAKSKPADTNPVNGFNASPQANKDTELPKPKVVIGRTTRKHKKAGSVKTSTYSKSVDQIDSSASGSHSKSKPATTGAPNSNTAGDISYLKSTAVSDLGHLNAIASTAANGRANVTSADNSVASDMDKLVSEIRSLEVRKGILPKTASKASVPKPANTSSQTKASSNASKAVSATSSLANDNQKKSAKSKAKSKPAVADYVAPKTNSAVAHNTSKVVSNGASAMISSLPGLNKTDKSMLSSYLAKNPSALNDPASAIATLPSSEQKAVKKFLKSAGIPIKSGKINPDSKATSASTEPSKSNAMIAKPGKHDTSKVARSKGANSAKASSAINSIIDESGNSDASSASSRATPESKAMSSATRSINDNDNYNTDNPDLSELNGEQQKALHDNYKSLAGDEANVQNDEDHSAHVVSLTDIKGSKLNVPHVANGQYGLFNKPEDEAGANELISGNQLKKLRNKDHTLGKTFMVFQVAKMSDGNTYYHVISYDAKQTGWINKKGLNKIGLSKKTAKPVGEYHKAVEDTDRPAKPGEHLDPEFATKYVAVARKVLNNDDDIDAQMNIDRTGLTKNLLNLTGDVSHNNSKDGEVAKMIHTYVRYNLDTPQYTTGEDEQAEDNE